MWVICLQGQLRVGLTDSYTVRSSNGRGGIVSQFTRALTARGRGERVRAERRRAESRDVKKSVDFRVGLVAAMKDARCLLEQEGVRYVYIEVEEDQMLQFNEALFSHELAGYDILQNPQKVTQFKIADKILF